AEIPDPFDWSYFQAAPADQRTDFLRGDEWVLLEGVHPTLPLLRTRLPEVRGLVRIHGLSPFGMPEGTELDLYLDTLRIDGDEECATVVFRRTFPVPDTAALADLRVVAGLQVRGESMPWFAPRTKAKGLATTRPQPVAVSPTRPGDPPDPTAEIPVTTPIDT